ncbi:hypothetical protein WEH80_32615 [Actinomycetes bacterium KLBMP 9759]
MPGPGRSSAALRYAAAGQGRPCCAAERTSWPLRLGPADTMISCVAARRA